jgi:type IV secretory pathway VirB10-like protein
MFNLCFSSLFFIGFVVRAVGVLILLNSTTVHAQNINQMQAKMNDVRSFCLQRPLQKYSINTKYDQCKGDAVEANRCMDEITRQNLIISKWNTLVDQCNITYEQPTNSPPVRPINPSKEMDAISSELARAKEAARKAAEGADEKNRRALRQVDELADERARIDEERERVRQRQEQIRQQTDAEQKSLYRTSGGVLACYVQSSRCSQDCKATYPDEECDCSLSTSSLWSRQIPALKGKYCFFPNN